MDALGCVFSAGLLLAVFVAFGIAGRIIDGAVGEIRYSIAPTVIGGMRAWEAARHDASSSDDERPGGRTHPEGGASGADRAATHSRARLRDGGLVVPVGPVRRRMAAGGAS